MVRLSREQSRDQTRSRIRAAAIRAFARQGVGGASIDGIAEAAGFSRGAFYSNYACKRDLLLELATETHVAEVAVWTGLIEQSPGFDQLMPALAARFDAYVGRAELGMLSLELQLEAKRDAAFGRMYREQDRRLMPTVEGLLLSLSAKAGRAPPVDVAASARALRALVSGLVLQAGSAPATLETRAGSIVTQFLHNLLGAAGQARPGVGP